MCFPKVEKFSLSEEAQLKKQFGLSTPILCSIIEAVLLANVLSPGSCIPAIFPISIQRV
jgi:hypothetical protein